MLKQILMTVEYLGTRPDVKALHYTAQHTVAYHKSSLSPFTTLHFQITQINVFHSVCLLALVIHLECAADMHFNELCDMRALFADRRTVSSANTLNARRCSSLIGGNPPSFPHQPVPLSLYSVYTRTHALADCHCSAVSSAPARYLHAQTEPVRFALMHPLDLTWGKQLAMAIYCIAWISRFLKR